MSEELNKEIVRRVVEEVWSKGDFSNCDRYFTPDYLGHDPAVPEVPPGVEGLKRNVTLFRSAFPDLRFTMDEQIASGDRVATRWTATGTHKGELFGYPPTGKSVTVIGVTIARFEGDRIAEGWFSWDRLSLMQQMGFGAQPGVGA